MEHGAVVIAAITSCTNTSNPSVMVGAGLLAKKAVERGLKVKPYVKTSLAPGSRVVTEYLEQAGLLEPLAELGFNLVGYGCTTCIGNSGPLPGEVVKAITGGRPGGGGGAFRQPQFRRARPSLCPRQLPGLAAAGGGLRPGRHGRYRPGQRAARRGSARMAAGLPARNLAHHQERSSQAIAQAVRPEMFAEAICGCLHRQRDLERHPGSRQSDLYDWDADFDLYPGAALFRRS